MPDFKYCIYYFHIIDCNYYRIIQLMLLSIVFTLFTLFILITIAYTYKEPLDHLI